MKKSKKKLKKTVKITLVALLLVITTIVGISFSTKDTKKEEEKEEKPQEEIKEEPKKEEKLNIIDINSNSRNIAVMINNIKNVWDYQSGLQDAYIVYEIIVEGGYTRLMAIYKDKDTEKIGSVRSARPYFLDYALENDAIYVHFGGSDQALDEAKTLNISNINFLYDSGYYRDKSLKLATEHTAFTSMDRINKQIEKKKYRTTTESEPLLKYTTEEIDLSSIENNQQANKVVINFSGSRTTTFEYDSNLKVYKRSQNNKEHIDYITKEQYTAKNIITYQVESRSIDSYGRQELKNIGSGNGYYITNGYIVPITWEKTSRNSKTVYKYMDGTILEVNDGNTHIEIQPKGRNITIE